MRRGISYRWIVLFADGKMRFVGSRYRSESTLAAYTNRPMEKAKQPDTNAI